MQNSWLALAAFFAAVAMCSCSGAGSGSFADGVVRGPLLTTSGSAKDAMDAQVRGRVTFAGGCLLLDQKPVVWPEETTWAEAAEVIVLPNGDWVQMGDRVAGAGGYPAAGDLETLLGKNLADAAARCTFPTGEVALFNPGSTVRAVN